MNKEYERYLKHFSGVEVILGKDNISLIQMLLVFKVTCATAFIVMAIARASWHVFALYSVISLIWLWIVYYLKIYEKRKGSP